jgi:DNA invertase Pin-like site-specific DNA recombinase
MLSEAQRATMLELHAQAIPKREIARLLKLSRHSVRQVLKANSSAVPKTERAEKATPYRQQ